MLLFLYSYYITIYYIAIYSTIELLMCFLYFLFLTINLQEDEFSLAYFQLRILNQETQNLFSYHLQSCIFLLFLPLLYDQKTTSSQAPFSHSQIIFFSTYLLPKTYFQYCYSEVIYFKQLNGFSNLQYIKSKINYFSKPQS